MARKDVFVARKRPTSCSGLTPASSLRMILRMTFSPSTTEVLLCSTISRRTDSGEGRASRPSVPPIHSPTTRPEAELTPPPSRMMRKRARRHSSSSSASRTPSWPGFTGRR